MRRSHVHTLKAVRKEKALKRTENVDTQTHGPTGAKSSEWHSFLKVEKVKRPHSLVGK